MRALIVSAIIAAGTPAFATDMPRYDVPQSCATIASIGGGYSEMVFLGCMRFEQAAYDDLKWRWFAVPDEIKQHCRAVARFGRAPSYQMLMGCVEWETADGDSSKPEFRY
jgi:hypothetical protein